MSSAPVWKRMPLCSKDLCPHILQSHSVFPFALFLYYTTDWHVLPMEKVNRQGLPLHKRRVVVVQGFHIHHRLMEDCPSIYIMSYKKGGYCQTGPSERSIIFFLFAFSSHLKRACILTWKKGKRRSAHMTGQ